MTPINPEAVHRTALLGMHDGTAPTIEDAISSHSKTGIVLVADTPSCTSDLGQAALLTALVTAQRAFGHVHVEVDAADTTINGGVWRNQTLAEVITAEGATIGLPDASITEAEMWPTILIGGSPTPTGVTSPLCRLRATWHDWTAAVRPVAGDDARTFDGGDSPCVLAAIGAGALAVSEAFDWNRGRAGSDSGFRSITIDLWDPSGSARTTPLVMPPAMAHAPYAWWLVGLGHLGQAYAWVITLLGYGDSAAVEVVLQDTDHVTDSTHSTGVLTRLDHVTRPKTRVVASQLEAAGLRTRIIERNLGTDLRIHAAEAHVALLGVDNLPTRRLTSSVHWKAAIDVGLGTGATDYASLVLRRFPGHLTSAQVPAWQDEPSPTRVPDKPAFEDATARTDACGLVELAGKAVGASFVGVIAATLAVAEACRELHGGIGHDVLTYDLLTAEATAATALTAAEVISLPLVSYGSLTGPPRNESSDPKNQVQQTRA